MHRIMAEAHRNLQQAMREMDREMEWASHFFDPQEQLLNMQQFYRNRHPHSQNHQHQQQYRYQPHYSQQRQQYGPQSNSRNHHHHRQNFNRSNSYNHMNSNDNFNRNNRDFRNGFNAHFSFGSQYQPEFQDIPNFHDFSNPEDAFRHFANPFFNQVFFPFNQQQEHSHQNQNTQRHNSKPKFTKRTITPAEYVEHIECPICLNRFDFNVEYPALSCGHFFHQECIEPWLQNNDTCPVCRQNIA